MKRVLVLIDFKESAANALKYSLSMFEDSEVEFYLLHMSSLTPSNILGDRFNEQWYEKALKSLKGDLKVFLEKSKTSAQQVQFIPLIRTDSFIDGIKQAINVNKIDLLIFGTKKGQDISRLFWGSKAVKLVQSITNCPILIIPEGLNYVQIKEILFSTNFNRPFYDDELSVLLEITKAFKSRILIMQLSEDDYLSDKQRKNKKQLCEIVAKLAHRIEKINWMDSEIKTLNKTALDQGVQWISLVNHKYNFLDDLLEEHLAKKACIYSHLPVLVLPELHS